MYKWFPLKEKFFFSSFSYFPVILCSDFFFQFQIQNLGVTNPPPLKIISSSRFVRKGCMFIWFQHTCINKISA
jgi:hypothetical protein